MTKDHRILAVVPARGGSKGIPLKNLRKVGGVSLVGRAGKVASKVPAINRAVVSTDHDGIAREAELFDLSAPYRRSLELSGDRIGDYEVLREALEKMEQIDQCTYDVIVMLQPTSPMRTPQMVGDTIDMLIKGSWDSVWTVSETDSKGHPLKQLVLSDGAMDYYDANGAEIIARQQLTPVYHRNGAAYAITRECLVNQQSIKGKRSGALIIESPQVSIDTEWDIELVEFLLERQT